MEKLIVSYGKPRENNVAYEMISMASILTELARYGEKKIIVSDANKVGVIKDVLDLFDISYDIKELSQNEIYITMKDSLWG